MKLLKTNDELLAELAPEDVHFLLHAFDRGLANALGDPRAMRLWDLGLVRFLAKPLLGLCTRTTRGQMLAQAAENLERARLALVGVDIQWRK